MRQYKKEKEYFVNTSVSYSSIGYIYFLIKNFDVVYVGQTINIKERLETHKREKDFDNVSIIYCQKSEMDFIESYYIHTIRPKLNKNHPSGKMVAPVSFRRMDEIENFMNKFLKNRNNNFFKKVSGHHYFNAKIEKDRSIEISYLLKKDKEMFLINSSESLQKQNYLLKVEVEKYKSLLRKRPKTKYEIFIKHFQNQTGGISPINFASMLLMILFAYCAFKSNTWTTNPRDDWFIKGLSLMGASSIFTLLDYIFYTRRILRIREIEYEEKYLITYK